MGRRSQVSIWVSTDSVCLCWVRSARSLSHRRLRLTSWSSYCFGAPYVCNELAAGGSCVAGAFAHPAFLKEHHFKNLKGKQATVANASYHLTHARPAPLYLSCSEIDHTFDTPSRRKALDILQEGKHPYHLQLFSGVEHGFALRGNTNDPYQRKCSLTYDDCPPISDMVLSIYHRICKRPKFKRHSWLV